MLNRHYNTIARKSFRSQTRLYAGIDARLDLLRILPAGPVLLVADERFVECDAARALVPVHTVAVRREPREEDLAQHLEIAKTINAASVVAIGGGSAIDTAKALHAEIIFGTFKTADEDRPVGAPALVVLPTTAGSGSETSRFFIIADTAGVKQSYRGWSFAPDIAVLDPVFLRDAGALRLTLGAFDAFMHLWETYVCRNERDPVVQMLALEGIPLIAKAIQVMVDDGMPDDDVLMGLQRASAFGGLAIANVRTGLVHTLGESLAPQVDLGHPETIYFFFELALAQYGAAIQREIDRLDRRLATELDSTWSFVNLRRAWQQLFERLGIEDRIRTTLAKTPLDMDLFLSTVARDPVLLKENPAPITPDLIASCVGARFEELNRVTSAPAPAAPRDPLNA